jgi:peptide-methionine (S)-S-oxide reductase
MTNQTKSQTRWLSRGLVAVAAIALGATLYSHAGAEEGIKIPPPAVDEKQSTAKMETAVFAGGMSTA